MDTKVLAINAANLDLLAGPVAQIRKAGLVVFPTETVYGLGALFNDETALLKVFAVKGRPADNPLIVHIWDKGQLEQVVTDVSGNARKLIEAFWPGPLTIVFPKQPTVSPLVTAGLPTVAVRMPSHLIAREFLKRVNIPVAAPSANLSGRPSPTKGQHVIEDLMGKVEYIIDSGPCTAGIESTVIKLEPQPIILRPGSITRTMIEAVLGEPVGLAELGNVEQPQAPGMKYRHYAPKAPATLYEGENHRIVREINQRLTQRNSSKVIVISSTENMRQYRNEWVLDLGPIGHPEVAAARLYDLLRFCDELNADEVLIEGVPSAGIGEAVLNRLRKAAGGRIVHVS